MKNLLYAVLLLFVTAASLANPPAEVVDLTSKEAEAETSNNYAFFWKREKETVDKEEKAQKPSSQESKRSTISSTEPHIALLLPLSGEYETPASAIRDGFISAFYLKKNNPKLDVTIYDTQNDQNIVSIYQEAVDKGAQLIVGPLTKEGIERLIDSNKIDLDIPIVTLNTVESRQHLPRSLFPFALNPEDEAYRLAEQAKHDGHARAVILAQDDSYGGRASSAFKRRFEQLGGRVVDILYFDPMRALEDPVRYILDVNSNNQASRMIDFIFLVAKPQQARQIPPLLKFYYAENVPIYAMSTVYSGTPHSALDNDLNGIVFCDSPWIINSDARDAGLNAAATQLLTNKAAQERLFAFGVDAFLVAQQIRILPDVFQLNIHGVTGQLYMDSSGFIVRNPPCARFSLGVPRVL